MRTSKILALGIVFSLGLSTVAMSCHSNYFIEIFTKIQGQKLTKDQVTSIYHLKKDFESAKRDDHRRGLSCSAHDKHVPDFIAACAGILTDQQYKAATGKDKTEVQKLRFEVNQLKKEIAELKALVKSLQK